MSTKGIQWLLNACEDIYDPKEKKFIGEMKEIEDYLSIENAANWIPLYADMCKELGKLFKKPDQKRISANRRSRQ